ncbi:MAG: PAS domain S-box protein [Lentimicrobium sp.]|nr:PAS domain S-box protein [Lentimicrobium sp.]
MRSKKKSDPVIATEIDGPVMLSEKESVAYDFRYRRMFQSAKDGILILDAESGKVIDMNPFLINLLGFPKENIIKKELWEIGFLNDFIDSKKKFLELKKNVYKRHKELQLNTAGGRAINVEFVSNLYTENDQNLIQCNIRNITKRKGEEMRLETIRIKLAEAKKIDDEAGEFAENVINTVREPLILLNKDLQVVKANGSFYKFFKVSPEDTVGRRIYELGNNQWDIPELRELLETVLPEKTTFENFEVQHVFSSIGKRTMLLNARQIQRSTGKEKIILLAIEDITDRKISEEFSNERERLTNEYLDILFNHAHVPIIIWDADLIITRYNHAFEELIGYNLTDSGDTKLHILFPEGKVDASLELIQRSLNDESPEIIEVNILAKDNNIKTVLWNSTNIFDSEGKKVVATVAQDITKRKQTEDALSILETRYRRLFESAKDGILILDAETGAIIDVNPFLIELLGYTKQDFQEKEIWEIGFFKDIAANKERFLELQQNEYVRYDNLPLKTADGRKISVEFVSNVYSVNNKKVIQCNIRDITKRKKAENDLIASETRLRTLIETIPDLIWAKDTEGKYISCNPMFGRFFGATEKQIAGKTDYDFVDSKLADFFRDNDQKAILAGKPVSNEEWVTFADDGHRAYLDTIKAPMYDDEQKIIGVLGIGRDITERKDAEKELLKAKEKAEESDRLKTAFLANMSHEIRTPMNGILGFTGLLKEPHLTGEEQKEYIDIIEKSGNRMLNIINDIISISKIESGQMKISVSVMNVNAEIEDIFNFFKQEAETKNIQLFFRKYLPFEETNIISDKEKVFAVLTNLVKNAIKFTRSGSIEIGCNRKGDLLEFYVKDTGTGVPYEHHELIFERFRQGSESLNRNYEGAGLGLSISKAYVEMLGGRIWVESGPNNRKSIEFNEDSGSTFYFTIPWNPAPEIKIVRLADSVNSAADKQPGNLKILIVEDDTFSEMFISTIIKKIAKEVLYAGTGIAAVEACRTNPDIDLVLMDLKMPIMDGYEATRQIRKFNTEVVIIAQSAYGLSGDREKSIEAGCNDYISKPINPGMLIKIIKSNLLK